MRSILHISTAKGDFEIAEEELASITKADLRKLKISRADLISCFEQGKRLMREHNITEADRKRPVADQHKDGTWMVNLVGYSGHSDPLMAGAKKGTVN